MIFINNLPKSLFIKEGLFIAYIFPAMRHSSLYEREVRRD